MQSKMPGRLGSLGEISRGGSRGALCSSRLECWHPQRVGAHCGPSQWVLLRPQLLTPNNCKLAAALIQSLVILALPAATAAAGPPPLCIASHTRSPSASAQPPQVMALIYPSILACLLLASAWAANAKGSDKATGEKGRVCRLALLAARSPGFMIMKYVFEND